MILDQYLYGFTYIECFYPLNIYKILYNALIDSNKTDFPHHRLFDPLFNYFGIIIFSLFIPKEEKSDKAEQEEEIDKRESILNIKLIHNDIHNYFHSKKGIVLFIAAVILWVISENLLIIYVDIFQDLDFWFFELIFLSIFFSRSFIFKIYQHQKLSIALNVGFGSILKICNIILSITSHQKDEDKNFYEKYPFLCVFALFYLLIIISNSYVITQLKVFMDIKFISHRTLLMSYGLAGFLICLISAVVFSYIPCWHYLEKDVCKINYEGRMYFDEFHNYIESWKNMLVRLIIIFIGMVNFFF